MTIQDVSHKLGYPMGAGSASDAKAQDTAAKQAQEPESRNSADSVKEADTFTQSQEPGGTGSPEWNGVTMTKTPISSKILRKLRWISDDMISGIKLSVDEGLVNKVKAGVAGAVTLGLPTAIVAGATILNPTLGSVAIIPSAIVGTYPGVMMTGIVEPFHSWSGAMFYHWMTAGAAEAAHE
ncbi:MAG: hypothetical protein AB9903_09840, partial [Vulcanimicrobiota bacterium]